MESFTSVYVRWHARHTFNRMQRDDRSEELRGKAEKSEKSASTKNVDEKNPA
ncbi:hypothetical protein AWB69_06592 [Caballeronia udeis]|uniref:Uncharacterized protein n=1 Tax=Caballeronia udeis TaxID=1232866 RepID=A0A158ISQ4_9BURK|nr:hypothetical protein AWB69_06592 [Caballeronia udeis]